MGSRSKPHHGPDRAAIWLMARIVQQMRNEIDVRQVEGGIEIGPREFVILGAAAERPQPQHRLGRAAGIDKSTLATTLDQLEARGFVVRRTGQPDRRTKLVEVTPAGSDALAAARALMQDVERDLTAPLTERESDILLSLLRRVLAGRPQDAPTQGSCI